MSRKSERSFLGHPSAKFFRSFSSEGLFQHPQAVTLRIPAPSILSAIGMLVRRAKPAGSAADEVTIQQEPNSLILAECPFRRTGADSTLHLVTQVS